MPVTAFDAAWRKAGRRRFSSSVDADFLVYILLLDRTGKIVLWPGCFSWTLDAAVYVDAGEMGVRWLPAAD